LYPPPDPAWAAPSCPFFAEGLAGGTQYGCRFGDVLVPAARVGQAVVCTSPPLSGAEANTSAPEGADRPTAVDPPPPALPPREPPLPPPTSPAAENVTSGGAAAENPAAANATEGSTAAFNATTGGAAVHNATPGSANATVGTYNSSSMPINPVDDLSPAHAAAVTALAPITVWLAVTANGRDFSPAAALTYYDVVPPLQFFEPPAGPLGGGTRVLLLAAVPPGGSAPSCRFGNVDVAASYAGGAGSGALGAGGLRDMQCRSPEADGVGAVQLQVSLNGQQWDDGSALYSYTEPPVIERVIPDVVPNVGGLIHEIIGTALLGGSTYLCRFGALTVPASADASAGSVLCMSPAGLLGDVRVAVSLNGQQFSEDGPLSRIVAYDMDGDGSLPPYGDETGGDSGVQAASSEALPVADMIGGRLWPILEGNLP